ncbi:MAG TPA: VCBS repeat-containing protein, partial [Chloroflexota bacterium]|nr:VCBS repeat-containing protein [Chloroflexota bacterium]
MDQKLYAWFTNGQPVPGFPMTPRSMFGNGNPANVGITPILGDYDGDGKMEIFVRTGPNVTIVDGNGQQLTASQNPPNAPAFYTGSVIQNNAALGDIDNDGKLELIAFNSTLYAWNLPDAGSRADWPMYRYNAARTGHPILPRLHTNPTTFVQLHEVDDGRNVHLTLTIHGVAEGAINWTAVAPTDVTVFPPNGQADSTPTPVAITVSRAGLTAGVNHRTITINGTIQGQP